MRNNKPVVFTIIVALSYLIFSCGDLPLSRISSSPFGDGMYFPKVPPSLSGGNTSRSISRAALPQDQWLTEYDQFVIVPEIANNYNFWLEDGIEDAIDRVRNNQNVIPWIKLNHPIFSYQISLPNLGEGSTLRFNEDFTYLELYVPLSNGEQRYLRVKETVNYTHSMLLMYHTGGSDHSDSVEIIETDKRIYTKCVRIHFITSDPILQHFVGITDKTTSDKKTVGRRLVETSRPDYTYSFTPGNTFDTDYFSQDDIGWGGSGYELYGFFNDSDYYVPTTNGLDQIDAGYISPQDLREFFFSGLNNEIIGHLNIDAANLSGGIDFPTWDESLIK